MNVILIVFVLLHGNILQIVQSDKMQLQMIEETTPNTEIGNILSLVPASMRESRLQYVIENQFFSVTEKGKLIVKKTIDLESLCLQYKECCGVTICKLFANIFISGEDRDQFYNVDLEVQIIDKNDHKPKFSTREQRLTISEFAQIGTQISLNPATDADATSTNRIKNYRLDEKTNTFQLDLSRLPSISLRLLNRLNYEMKDKYEARLQACDLELCTDQQLIINVKDENDNQPIFEHENYNFTIREDLDLQSVVGQVTAKDSDSGKFGEIRYSISSDLDLDLRQTFNIDLKSGKITLKQRLSTNTRDFYKIRIIAKDSDPLNPKQAMCQVSVKVEDVNDHRPEIKMFSKSGPLNISEGVAPRYITTLQITDKDQGNNAIVDCRLDPNCEDSFQLKMITKNLYSLKSIRVFDHEKEQKIDVIISCKDHGVPSLESRKILPIYITDVNEHRPEFKPNDAAGYFTANVMENSPMGTKVLRIVAQDRDKSAVLQFQIDSKGAEYFDIDSKTGMITCSRKQLDRERMPSITFTVHVRDSLSDPKTASIQVKITILDANDNAPIFPPNLPQFSVIENTQPKRLFGQITAIDNDQDENAQITYSLVNTWNANTMRKHDGYFHVVSSGYIETLATLDRETCDMYILEVRATDNARHPQIPLTSSVNVTLRVIDENDNSPQWTYPDLAVYNISDSMKPGDHLIQLNARDRDYDLNGRVRYDIVRQYRKNSASSQSGRQESQYFALNSTTGHLWVAQVLHAGTVVILFRASDLGRPSRSTDLQFIVNISGDDNSNLNMTIIAVMITVTAVISLFLIVAIICVRRKPPKYRTPNSSIITKDPPGPDWLGLSPSDESLMAYPTANKSPYISNTLRHPSSVGTDNTVQMHTFAPNCVSYEPVDGDSGDSGKGPSEEGSNPHHLSQEGSNYFTLRQPIRSTFRSCPQAASPSRSACYCYVLPEDSMIKPGHPAPYPSYSQNGNAAALMSPMSKDRNSGVYCSYSSLSLPRHHFQNSVAKVHPNSVLKFHPYSPLDSVLVNDYSNQIHIPPSNSSECSTPRVNLKLTPMHLRKVSELDSVSSNPDERSSSLVTSTTSAASSTKTVLYNGPPISVETTRVPFTQNQTYSDSSVA